MGMTKSCATNGVWLLLNFVVFFAYVSGSQFDRVRRASRQLRVEDDKSFVDTTPVRFPGSAKSTFVPHSARITTKEKRTSNSSRQEIPVSIFLNKDINSLDDFVSSFMKNKNPADLFPRSNINSSDGNSDPPHFPVALPVSAARAEAGLSLRNSVNPGDVAIMAQCMPQLTVVELEKPTDPAYLYWPPCTKIDRCGGCCIHDRLSCQPTQIDNVEAKIAKMRYDAETEDFEPDGFLTVILKKHVSCECRCRVKEEDCNPMQHYRPNECRCVCNNENDALHCIEEHKFWDPQICSCTCRNVHDCSTGFIFDTTTCSCQQERNRNFIFRSVLRDRNLPRPLEENYEIVEPSRTNTPVASFRIRRDAKKAAPET